MKNKFLYLVVLLAFSCGTEETPGNQNESTRMTDTELEQSGELSRFVAPHLTQEDMSIHSFPKSVYNQVDEMKNYVNQIQKLGFGTQIPGELNEKYIIAIESFVNNIEDVDPDSHGVLQEYAVPLREIFTEIEVSPTKDTFENNIREAKLYLINFRKLFPE